MKETKKVKVKERIVKKKKKKKKKNQSGCCDIRLGRLKLKLTENRI